MEFARCMADVIGFVLLWSTALSKDTGEQKIHVERQKILLSDMPPKNKIYKEHI